MTHKSHSGIYSEKQKPVVNQLFKNDLGRQNDLAKIKGQQR
jgi:hypothetical protein